MRNWLSRIFTTKQAVTADHKAHGDALLDQGAWSEAAACYQLAIAADASNTGAHNNLGMALLRLKRHDEARLSLQHALSLDGGLVNSLYLLASLAHELGNLDEAGQWLEQAVAVKPDFSEALSFLGTIYREQGRTTLSVACYRKSLALSPGEPNAHSNLLLALQAEGTLSQAELFAAHLRFGQSLASAQTAATWQTARRATVEHQPQRRIKLAYVSADFRRHSVAHFMLPVLEHHDRTIFETSCYYNHHEGDDMTQRFIEQVDHFIPCAAMSDDELAERIRADDIDILVDLSGHTAGNRLPVLARKPAPVQVTYLGYIDTTGLAAIDYRLTNADADPAENDAFYSERLLRLPGLWWAFRPAPNLPEVVALPATANGHIRFCSTNQIGKISPAMIAIWADILQQVNEATLTIMGVPSAAAEAALAEHFAACGIARARLEFHRFDTLDAFRATLATCDIALDTFPYNGGTTTCEILWSGLPCVTLTGSSFVSRMGYALLKEIGLPELAATNGADYVAIAVALAQDRERLAAMRVGMRERLQASSLGDESGFTRSLEAAYLKMHKAAQ